MRRRERWILLAALPFVLVGCFLSVSWDELSGGSADAGGEGTSQADATPNEGTSNEAGTPVSDSGADSGGRDADADASAQCPDGPLIVGATAFDLGIASGSVCASENALADDGKVVGLDRLAGNEGLLDGKNVTGCVGIDFGHMVHLTAVLVHAGPSADACGSTPCVVKDAGCGTGHTLSVFGGTKDALRRADVVYDADTNAPYLAMFEAGGRDVSAVAVCREGWGTDRDDIDVDFVAGVCE